VNKKLPGGKLNLKSGKRRLSDHDYFIADNNMASFDLGWNPIVSIPEGLAMLQNWVMQDWDILKAVVK